MQIFFYGIVTGLFLQLAIGPLFFLILNITLSSSYINTLSAIIGVTLADYLCITLALVGINKIQKKDKGNKLLGVISSMVLILFGGLILFESFQSIQPAVEGEAFNWTPLISFMSCFVITISSPLTLVFWSGIFSAKAIERGYQSREFVFFGIGAGSATFIFMSLVMLVLSSLKVGIPDLVIQILNCLVGIMLVGYGLMRGWKVLTKF